MQKRTRPKAGLDGGKSLGGARCWSGALAAVLLVALCLAQVSLWPADGHASERGRYMLDRMDSRASGLDRSRNTASSEQPLKAVDVQYAPLTPETTPKVTPETAAADQEGAPVSEVAAAETPASESGESQSRLVDPAEKAAQRARAFRLSMKGSETATTEAGSRVEIDSEDASSESSKGIEETVYVSMAGAKAVVPDKALKFEECVHLALKQSPYFVESAMEVQLRRIAETDSWYQLLPKFIINTGYVVTRPDSDDSSDRFGLSFSTGSYDPIAAGFSIQATKLVTEIAILAHMTSINKGLYNLGSMFLELGQLEQLLVVQDELVSLAKHEKTYLSNLLETGGTNPLEVRIAEQQVEMEVLERERVEAKRDEIQEDLKIFLGLKIEDPLKLDLADSGNQVLGYFSPNEVSVADVRANSIELKILKQRREIQEYNIKLAWAQFLPKVYFQLRTADPIDNDDADDGLYSSVGFTWTLWDWGERYRNVRRQRMTTRQGLVKENIEELDIASDWRSGLSSKRRTLASLKVARAEVELAGLRKRQGEISYQSGTHPFPVYLGQIREYFEARKIALEKELADERAMFDLRFMAGDLFNSYINAENF